MSEESPITNPDLYESIDKSIGGAVEVIETSKRKRRRRSSDEELPLPLEKLSGREVIEILDFLHRRYLSWMTEAEASKFSVVYKTAKEDALKESLEIYNEITKQQQQIIENLNKLASNLSAIQQLPKQVSKEVVQEAKRSILDDPRVRTLIFVGLESFLANNQTYKQLRPLIAQLLIPEAFQQQQGQQQSQQEESGSNEGKGEG